jgi:6-phosphofructokinase 1
MNAAIRAVVRSADATGVETIGIRNGFAGLIEGTLEPLDARAVSGILHWGGTILGTARSREFRTSEGRRQALPHLGLADVDGLVVIGGDGSFRGADALSREGHVRVVGIPGTIDNDLSGTDFTLGFDTAVNTALMMIDRVRDTAASLGRLFFVEVMGAGYYKLGNPYQIAGRWYYPSYDPSYAAVGVASWYGYPFHGRATANGELRRHQRSR